jgi:hypothetical protein
MATEVVTPEKWLAERREIAQRKVRIPDRKDIKESTMLNPGTKVYRAMMTEILTHTGEELDSFGITHMLIDAYNRTLDQRILSGTQSNALMGTLDLYVEPMIEDKEVMRAVRQNLSEVLDRAAKK